MKLDEMFPRRYASGTDLNGKAITLTILRIESETMRPSPASPSVQRYVLYFDGAQKGVVLSRQPECWKSSSKRPIWSASWRQPNNPSPAPSQP